MSRKNKIITDTLADQVEKMQAKAISNRVILGWSQWLVGDGGLHVYVRVGMRYLFSVKKQAITIDIANVNVSKQGKGTFTKFITEVEGLGYPIYVENVLGGRFCDFLHRRGYTEVGSGIIPSYEYIP